MPLTSCQFEPNVMWHYHGQTQQCFVSWSLIFSETLFVFQTQIKQQNIRILCYSIFLFLSHSPFPSLYLFHFLTSSLSFLYPCLSFLSSPSGPICSACVDNFGARPVTIFSGVMVAGGLMLSAFAPNVQFLIFSYGIVVGKETLDDLGGHPPVCFIQYFSYAVLSKLMQQAARRPNSPDVQTDRSGRGLGLFRVRKKKVFDVAVVMGVN